MLARYHKQITINALGTRLSTRALQTIVKANLGQDNLPGLIFHPEFHFDNNLFDEGNAHLIQQRQLVMHALEEEDAHSAWNAFGRMTHALQDFYAHSNYVELWVEHHERDGFSLDARKDGGVSDERFVILSNIEQDDILPSIPFEQIDPLDLNVLNSPALRSGRVYYLREAMSYIPGLHSLARRLSPTDSHAHMNLDGPERGAFFSYAVVAAAKRTVYEFDDLKSSIAIELGQDGLERFIDI